MYLENFDAFTLEIFELFELFQTKLYRDSLRIYLIYKELSNVRDSRVFSESNASVRIAQQETISQM